MQAAETEDLAPDSVRGILYYTLGAAWLVMQNAFVGVRRTRRMVEGVWTTKWRSNILYTNTKNNTTEKTIFVIFIKQKWQKFQIKTLKYYACWLCDLLKVWGGGEELQITWRGGIFERKINM